VTRWIQRTVLLSLAVAGVALLVWWWLRRCRLEEEVILETEVGTISRVRGIGKRKAAPTAPSEPAPLPARQTQASQVEGPVPARRVATRNEIEAAPADDLKRIEGIGPKISGVLQTSGIVTFAQLAATDVDRLKHILSQAGLRLANPDTWPEQARLAADGNWEGLKNLQNQLKGGHRL
jgi:predicted flap endonuclease-1-like 5' DNA nuclease